MITEHHKTGEGFIKLGRAPPMFHLTFEGWNGFETTVWFDYAEVHDDVVGLYLQGGEILVGEFETDLQFEKSSVASALRAIEHNELQAGELE